MARKSTIPISERKSISISLSNSYSFQMKEILKEWEEEGLDFSSKACEYITSFYEIMKVPKLASQISQYLLFSKMYKNGTLENKEEKLVLFEKFLIDNDTENSTPNKPTFQDNSEYSRPIFQDNQDNSEYISSSKIDLAAATGDIDISDNIVNNSNEEISDDDFFDDFLNE
ncbi:hypothetical protein [Clostridium sp.]|uniref:hypothetical protein n=1 Tax=Clostridium sp. TaxID=1506 RepID=UPI001B42F6A1|nr:hypothetical protein [Clostridium sp.]MBP3917419.1 hypothetical protein [Clostridium sp.]